jgi:hypothetical protein
VASLPCYCCLHTFFSHYSHPASLAVTWPPSDRFSPRYPNSHFTCLPPSLTPFWLLFFLLFIVIFNVYCLFYLNFIYLAYPYIFPRHRYSIPYMLPAVSAVCTLGTPSSFTFSLSTPLSPWFYPICCHHAYWLLPHAHLPI